MPNNKNISLDSFNINSGDVIQIKASSGQGKSYFYQTLLGFTSESIKLYGTNNIPKNIFSYCPASLPFFSETVEDELHRVGMLY